MARRTRMTAALAALLAATTATAIAGLSAEATTTTVAASTDTGSRQSAGGQSTGGSPSESGSSAADAADAGRVGRDLVKLQLLTFNDYHGHLEPPRPFDDTLGPTLDPSGVQVGGAEYLATTLTQLRRGHRPSITATAGDLIGGSPFLSGLFHDEPSVESLDAMGLDVSSVGNHEFDEGVTELVRMQQGGCHPADGCYFPDRPYPGADFRWLAANVVHKPGTPGAGRPVLPATWVRTVQGVKVGFIGMTLEDTPVLVAQAGIAQVEFRDEVETANAAVRRLRDRGVKAIVVLLHEGGVQSGTFGACAGISGPIVAIAEQLHPEIDMVVTGHTHQPYVCNIPDPWGRARMVTSASSYGRVVTESTLPIDRATGQVRRWAVESANHLVTRTVAKDPGQSAIIAKWQALSAPVGNRVVGGITADITRSVGRDTESSLANLIADAQLASTAGPAGAQIALMNPGGVRADLAYLPGAADQPGEVTYAEAFQVQPFGNLLVTKTFTGQQVDDVLERQYILGRPGGRDTLILGISQGLTFTYSSSAAAGSRISDVRLNGAPIDLAATYRVTMNSFLSTGGDAFTTFALGTDPVGGGDDLVALVDYLGANTPVAPPPTDRITEVS